MHENRYFGLTGSRVIEPMLARRIGSKTNHAGHGLNWIPTTRKWARGLRKAVLGASANSIVPHH
jgi:hypothetical protein